MTGRSYTLVKVLALLFALNSFPLYQYFHSVTEKDQHLQNPTPTAAVYPRRTEDTPSVGGEDKNYLKPWPILPSYLPWTEKSDIRPGSCEGYFGNGFTRRHEVLSSSTGGGWFRCYFNPTLRSSICEGGKLRMVPEKIRMAEGGENLEDVMGRGEDEEFPIFEDGAFEIEGSGNESGLGFKMGKKKNLVDRQFLDSYIPSGRISRHTMRDLIGSIRVVKARDFHCDQWVEETTLLVTRFEYANLFHTMTDWYNGYISSRVTELPFRPRVIFIDGHCTVRSSLSALSFLTLFLLPHDIMCRWVLWQSPMEETWSSLFSGFTYAKRFHGSVCFKHAVLSPLGYENVLFKGLSETVDCRGVPSHQLLKTPDDRKIARLSEFGEMIPAGFGFPINRYREKSTTHRNVLFVRREDYLAHPRHNGKPESRLSNEAEIFDALKSWAGEHLECRINIVNGLFGHMSMKEQVEAIQDASVIISAHGAGLTHIVSATPETVVLEIVSSAYRRPHFELIARWKGLEYSAIHLGGSHAHPPEVVGKLRDIMKSLGC